MPETPRLRGAVRRRFSVTAADGTPLSVLVATPPPGAPHPALPPVLAVHGFASNAADEWGRTGHLDTLARAGRTVIAPDLRGHGQSGKPHRAEAYTLDLVLDDLRRALAEVAGRLAASAAGVADAEMTAAPEMTEMTGLSAMPDSAAWAAAPFADSGMPRAVDILGYSLGSRLSWALAVRRAVPVRRMVLGGFDGRPLFEGADAGRLDSLAARVDGNDRIALRDLVEGLAGTGGAAAGAPPDVPTLVVAGDADDLAVRAAAFAGALPHGSLLSVPGRDHISAVPAKVFRRGVADFLGQRP